MGAEFDKRALYGLSYGLYIVSTSHEGKLNGQIANTVFQVTSEPAKISVCLNKQNLTHEMIEKSGYFAASILDESVPMEFIGLFGFKSGRDVDKFAEVSYKTGVTGCPIVTEHALSAVEAKVVQKTDVGTHTMFVGEVVGGEVIAEGTPLTYAVYHDKKKGKAPKTAPTYRGEDEKQPEKKAPGTEMAKFVCNVCGYVYDPEKGDPDNGAEPGTSFAALPDNWVCPICGAAKSEFSPQA